MGKKLSTMGLLAILLAASFWFGATPARGTGFVVNANFDDADAHDANLGDCLCADTYGWCTLRAAVEEANQCAGADTITFQSAMNINVTQGSFQLYETVTIDASSVWDAANNAPGVMINGGNGSFAGLYVDANSCQFYGLYITNFGGAGILVYSASNWIGGTGAGQRNVLSGNRMGISLSGSSAQNNVLYNNYIGLTPAGDTKNPNDTGLYIGGDGAKDNIVGGSGAGQVNYIAGNTGDGVVIEGTGSDNNWLGGNVIGLATDLSTNLGNGTWGIHVRDWAANTVIGGASNSGNVISYSAYSGISVQNASGTHITHNLISGNGSDGIDIADSTACVVSNNLIGANTLNGVRISGASAAGNLIWPNSIFNNGGKGIYLQNGSNMGISAPTISQASHSGASGTVCAGCRVALYSDSADEGQIYHDIVQDDGTGHWTYSGLLYGPYVTATAIDGSGNTSEFSAPYTPAYQVFVPVTTKNY